MNKLRHPVAALIVMAMSIALILQVYEGMQEGYGVEKQYLIDDKDIMQSLEEIDLISGAQAIIDAIDAIAAPSNPLDLLGALTAAGIGVLNVVKGIITFPYEIFSVLGDFYNIPAIIAKGLGLIINIYVLFIVLSVFVGKDV